MMTLWANVHHPTVLTHGSLPECNIGLILTHMTLLHQQALSFFDHLAFGQLRHGRITLPPYAVEGSEAADRDLNYRLYTLFPWAIHHIGGHAGLDGGGGGRALSD